MPDLMPQPDAQKFAMQVVQKLRDAGHQAYWAGGCVRDLLLDRVPKDYDVATSATPDQVRELFGRRRTLAVGAAFGVVVVLAPRPLAPVEVATFRRDGQYLDGRHPESVQYSTAEEDAQRRDFTINGMFYDPLAARTLDFVGGQEDLRRGIVRAIGDPQRRFDEDKLRMLRAVRFAATFEFALDPLTAESIRTRTHDIVIVSAERICGEMQRMLLATQRARAILLLQETELLAAVLPEPWQSRAGSLPESNPQRWITGLAVLAALDQPNFAVALAALLWMLSPDDRTFTDGTDVELTAAWKMSNDHARRLHWITQHWEQLKQAPQAPWPQLQRVLIQAEVHDCLELARVLEGQGSFPSEAVAFCDRQLTREPADLNPPHLLDGRDLMELDVPRGPVYKTLLDATRDAQLEGLIDSRAGARAFVQQWLARSGARPGGLAPPDGRSDG